MAVVECPPPSTTRNLSQANVSACSSSLCSLAKVPSPHSPAGRHQRTVRILGGGRTITGAVRLRRTVWSVRRFLLGSRLRRFPAKLAACAVKVSSWSRPGQSRPRSTGTGKVPGHDSLPRYPGFARGWATRRVGNVVRCPPCPHLMGILALESASGANTAGETKLIALPVSNSAWKERPLTLTRA